MSKRPSSDPGPARWVLPPLPSPPPLSESAPPSSSGSISYRELEGAGAAFAAGPRSRPAGPAGSGSQAERRPRWRMPPPYQLVRRLLPGRLLFEAHNQESGRRVAVQLFKGVRDEAALVERHAASAQLARAQTVRLLDVGVVEHPFPVGYLVREYVRGESLSSRLEREPRWGVEAALQLALSVLASLEEAHARGMVHGRLQPDHVLVRASERGCDEVKVLGYWPSSSASAPFEPCSSPELRAQAAPTPASDVFAAGVLLFRAIAGRYPAPQSVGRELDTRGWPSGAQWLLPVLATALAPAPEARYRDAGAMRQALLHLSATRRVLDGLAGSEATGWRPVLRPARHELLATRPVVIWVLDDDPSMRHPVVAEALENLRRLYRVRVIGVSEQLGLLERLIEAELAPPWVLLHGSQSLDASAALLRLLSQSAEVSRVLLTETEQLEALRRAVDEGGVDQHVALPCLPAELVESVTRAVRRARRCRFFYDAIRAEAIQSREAIVELSREIAASPPA